MTTTEINLMSDDKNNHQLIETVIEGNNSSSSSSNAHVDSSNPNSTPQPVPIQSPMATGPNSNSGGNCDNKQSPSSSCSLPSEPVSVGCPQPPIMSGPGPGGGASPSSCLNASMSHHASPAPPAPPLTPSSSSNPTSCLSAPLSSLSSNPMTSGAPVGQSQTATGTGVSNQRTSSSHSMDSQYMQQQSQIFVFSTQLANQAAEAVGHGVFPSIIAYHCSQPATKMFLEKHPLKTQQFNRQNQPGAAFLQSLNQRPGGPRSFRSMMMQQNNQQIMQHNMHHPHMHHQNQFPPPPNQHNMGPMNHQQFPPGNNQQMMGPNGPFGPPCGPSPHQNMGPGGPWPSGPDGPWNNSNNPQFMGNSPSPRFPNSPMGGQQQMSGGIPPNSAMGPNFNGPPNFGPNFGPNHQQQHSMHPHGPQGRQVRSDDELTPQQRQHREEQLARIRQLQALFENDPNGGQQSNPCGGVMMRPPGPDGSACPPGMMGQQQMCEGHKASAGNPSGPMQGNPSPSSGDWGKMGPQFEEKSPNPGGRRRGGSVASGTNTPIPVNSPSSSLVASPNPGRMSSAPPPPYHQGPRPPGIKSPHPASPATGPMSCPLPSPRKQSPADQTSRQSHSSSHPYSSPGTPSAPDVSQGIKFEQTSPPSANGPRSVRGNPSIASPADSRKDLSDIKSESGSKFSSLSNSSSSPLTCQLKNEPQLMPVPSPQHIQYLNSFEGQELTIQKQPNTSLRDSDLMSSDHIDLNFQPSPYPPHSFQSQGPMENGMRYSSPMMNNNPMMDNNGGNNPQQMMGGPRFPSPQLDPHQMPPNNGQFCPGDNRFMSPDSMQRMPHPNQFDGPHGPPPHHRMPHPNDPNMGSMRGGPFPPMDGNMRFHGPPDGGPHGPGPNRMRGASPQMGPNRFCGPPPNDSHFSGPMGPNHHPPHCNFPSQPMTLSSGPPVNETISSTHLQKLQTMTPPFDIGAPQNKMDMSGPNSLMSGQQGPQNRSNQFDPLSSMANIANMDGASSGGMGMGGPMGMTSVQSGSGPNGPNGNTTVNFHTQMNSMQNMSQAQINNCNNSNNGNMNAQFGGHMVGGPQTVNNTYVNANLQIQQLNIQQPNYGPPNPNMPQNQGMHPGPPGGPMGHHPHNHNPMGMPQSMSPKLGQNGPRMSSSPNSNCSFPPPPGGMGNPPGGMQRGMAPGGYPGGPNNGPPMGPRGPRGSPVNNNNYGGPNVNQMKPNTISYHPGPRGPNGGPNQQKGGAPNLDFLNYAAQLTNLDNKVPTHNLQYFPKDSSGPPQNSPGGPNPIMGGPPMGPSGPGRPQLVMRGGPGGMGPQMMSGGNPNFGPDFSRRPPGPHNNGPPPNAILMPSGPGGPPPGGNPMYGGPGGCGPPGSMSPGLMGPGVDASQPLPPSVGHGPPGGYGSYGQKQQNFNPNSNMTSDPNYEAQYQSFQQQLYATNTRGGNGPVGPGGPNPNPQAYPQMSGGPNVYGPK